MTRGVAGLGDFRSKIMLLGLLSPLCFSLLVGHVPSISEVLPESSGESRRSEPEAALSQ